MEFYHQHCHLHNIIYLSHVVFITGVFKLDAETGILYPAERLEGKPREFHLVVEGQDEEGNGPHADTTTIDIEIRDVNQNKPVFIMPSLPNATIEVPEVCSLT